jgi:hypothetical protein
MSVLRAIVRLPLRFLALLLFMLIRGRRVVLAAVAVVAIGWVLVANVNRLPIPAGAVPSFLSPGSSTNTTAATRTAAGSAVRTSGATNLTLEQVPSVNSYIKGLTEFDARLMWNSLAEDALNAMRARGGSLEALQSGLDDAKRRGARYEDITMIGTYPLQGGGKYLFYVLSRRGFSGTEQLEQVYFVFTVNPDGKISRIE